MGSWAEDRGFQTAPLEMLPSGFEREGTINRLRKGRTILKIGFVRNAGSPCSTSTT
jgi:hypothetical protein